MIWNWLLDGERPADSFEIWSLNAHGDKPNSPLRALWASLGDAIVSTYADVYPGRRPRAWWRLEAPEMRRRIGGHGVSESDLVAVLPRFEYGVPMDWCEDDWIWTRDGGTPPEDYVPFDRADPPRYESHAAYLKRLKLFLPGEAQRLKAADFEPESVHIEPDDNDDATEESING